jgi:ferredoxin-fold anticodon binding domain-containing protein
MFILNFWNVDTTKLLQKTFKSRVLKLQKSNLAAFSKKIVSLLKTENLKNKLEDFQALQA